MRFSGYQDGEIAALLRLVEPGAGLRVGPFRFRLSLPDPSHHLTGRHLLPCPSRSGTRQNGSTTPSRLSQTVCAVFGSFGSIFPYFVPHRQKSSEEMQYGKDAEPQLPQPVYQASN